MAELKTKPSNQNVSEFIATVTDETKRNDCLTLLDLMRNQTQAEPKMWGDSIIGFGDLHLKYASGREVDWFVCGFSPRKANLTIYSHGTVAENAPLLAKLGKHKAGMGCIYIKKLSDIDLNVLKQIVGSKK